MKSLSKRVLAVVAAAVVCVGSSLAETTVKHIVAQDETLPLIAQQYDTTENNIIAMNPEAAESLSAGMELTIPVADATVESVTDFNLINVEDDFIDPFSSDKKKSSDVTASDFSSVYVSWLANYDAFEYGSYGLGFISFSKSGFGWTLSAHANYGIVDSGNVAFLFGPAYGYPVLPNILLYGQLRGYIYDSDSSSDIKVNGGVFFAPGIKIKLGKLSLGAAFNFGWVNGVDDLAKNFELTLGFKI